MNSAVIKAKEQGPVAMATVATALQLLQSATSVPGCPPAIAPVCAIALQVIQKTQETQQNREACKELAEKISKIMVALVTPYTKQKDLVIQFDMLQNIEQLHGDLAEISTKLQKVLGKNALKKWVLSTHYKQEIAGYSTKLDWAVNFFKFETLIRIEGKIDMLHSNSSVLPATGISNQLLGWPPKPEIFYGRQEVVEDVIVRLVSTPNGRFSIGGPGGLGKTSVALTAAHDPRVVARFQGSRYWVPCEQATSASALVRLLAGSIKISTSSADLLALVVAELGRDNSPKLMLLDNFETPWDPQEERLDIGNILAQLVSVPSVTLVLTVRSERPPCDAIDWTHPVLKPLDPLTLDAARQLYMRRHPDATVDATLDALLAELSYMPLAVTLVAARGAAGETPHELLNAWRKYGTGTFDRDDTRLGSIRASIRLSTESRAMKDNPDALRLLSLLTLLPAGAPKSLLADLAPDMDASKAFHVLQRVSLAYLSSQNNCICLLSPIQQFISESHPPAEQQLETVFRIYRDLLIIAGDKIDSEGSWAPISQALATHSPNVESILLQCLEGPDPGDAIDLVIQFCDWTNSPGYLRLVQASSAAAARLGDPFLTARCNYELAGILRWTDRHKAINILKDALVTFRDINDEKYTLMCLKWIAEYLCLDDIQEETVAYAEQAADLAKSLGDDAEYAKSLETLARIAIHQQRLDDALIKMEQVDQIWQRTAHTRGDSRVIGSLLIHADLLRQCKRFEEALKKLDEAAARIPESAAQSYLEAWRQRALGDLYDNQERIDEALAANTASAAEYRNGGCIEYALWRQTDIGDILVRQAHQTSGDCADAMPVLERTLTEAQTAGFQEILDYCSEVLDDISKCLQCRREGNDESAR